MSRIARARQAQDQELERIYCGQDWREARDRDDEELPEPDEDEPVNTLH